MTRKRIILRAAAGALGLALAFALWNFAIAPMFRGQAEQYLVLQGNIDIRQVQLGFRVNGRIAEMFVEEGDRVEAGTALAHLDPESLENERAVAAAELATRQADLRRLEAGMRPAEIRSAEARVIEARASQRSAEETARRQETLFANGAVSQQSATESRARAEETRARLHVAEAALNLAREGFRAEDVDAGRAALAAAEARLRTAETRLADATLKAPSAGVVLARVREPGAIVQPGETALTLALDRPLWVRAYVQGEDLARVAPGAEAEVWTDAAPDRRYRGQVGFVSPTAEFTPRTVQTENLRSGLVYQVRIIVAEPDALLRQGMPASVGIRALNLESAPDDDRERP
jgi:HlyD family secretion protein